MNITQQNTDELNATVKIKLDPSDYKKSVEKIISEQSKKAKIPGFRPGMVPASHIKKLYGKSILVDEINKILSETLTNYIQEKDLQLLGQPLPKIEETENFKWDFEDEFEFNYELGLAPTIDIQFSDNNSFDYYKVEADDETLNDRIKNLRKSYGKRSNPEISDQDDLLYGEFVQLSPDGTIFEGGVSNTNSLRTDLVENETIKASLIGLKKDDVVNINLSDTFDGNSSLIAKLLNIDEQYAAELKSKFQFTIKNINRVEEADLDQEFFDKIYPDAAVTTEEEFRSKVKEELEGMMVGNSDSKLQSDLYEYSLNHVNVSFPDTFLKKWLRSMNEENITDEQIESEYGGFQKNLKWTLIQNKLMKDHDINIDSKDIVKLAKQKIESQFRMYSQAPIQEDQLNEYVMNFLKDKERVSQLNEEARAVKVFEFLKSVVKLNNKTISYKEFLELK
ncbi:MAG: trigger factor [Ignavibacteria bacterium]|nr:trigger factor [Ignavibacteria bacterium]